MLPGVGAFGACAQALRESGLDVVARQAIDDGLPFLGICVGFQLLFEGSDESPDVPGLGVLSRAWSERLAGDEKLPQMQWNQVRPIGRALGDVPGGGRRPVVLLRALLCAGADRKECEAVVGTCDYGGPVVAAVESGALWGVQFHPEKSGRSGLALLARFVEIVFREAGVAGDERSLVLHPGDRHPRRPLRAPPPGRLRRRDDLRRSRSSRPGPTSPAVRRRLHVVDLDAARSGVGENDEVIAAIAAALSIPIEVGGGVRTLERAATLLDLGVDRVVIGTVAVEEPALLAAAVALPGRVALGLDHRRHARTGVAPRGRGSWMGSWKWCRPGEVPGRRWTPICARRR